jgi:hypothetical protein
VVFRADSDVLTLLEQAIVDASGESVHVRLLPNGWLSSPPLMAVIDQQQTRYLFSPLPSAAFVSPHGVHKSRASSEHPPHRGIHLN